MSNVVLTVNVPAPAALAKGVKVQKGKIAMRLPALTNLEHVDKGCRLLLEQEPPTELESDEEEIEETA